MANLEAKLRELADAGNFSHLSILSTTCRGTDGSTRQGFCASFSPAAEWGRGHSEIYADPVTAALEAIERAPKGRTVSRGVVHSPAPAVVPVEPMKQAESAPAVEAPGQANIPQPRPSLMGLFTNEDNDD